MQKKGEKMNEYCFKIIFSVLLYETCYEDD